MNCPICGAKIENGASFCTSCGAQVASSEPQAAPAAENAACQPQNYEPQSYEPQSYEPQSYDAAGNQQTPPASGAPYGQQPPYGQPPYGQPPYGQPAFDPTVNAYYAREFASIAQGGKSRFNWAAFFLGGYQALYRGHTRRFLTFYLPIFVLNYAAVIVNAVAVGSLNIGLVGVMSVVTMLIGLAALVISIVNGFTFNKSYYQLRSGDAHVPAYGGRVALLIVACVVLGIAVSVFSSMMMLGSVGSYTDDFLDDYTYSAPAQSIPSDDIDTPDPDGGSEQIPAAVNAASLDEVLTTYSFVESDQIYYFGYCDPAATEDQALVESGMLFCSDDVTLLDAVTNGADESRWETYVPEQDFFGEGSKYYSFYCTIGEDEVVFDTVFGGGNVVVFAAYYWDGTQYADLSEQETCAVLAYLYDCAGMSGEPIAAFARGTWQTDTGEQFTMDGENLNGQPYTLWFLSDGILAVYLDDDNDVEYYMMDAGDGVLNVWQYDADGNIINDLYYTKVG